MQPDDVIRSELLQALKHDQLVLYYQPQFNLYNGKFDGLEALLRWQHPGKGLLQPNSFLSIAEQSGLIVLIGEWVLKQACQQNKSWQDQQLNVVRIAVNVARRQFEQKNFVDSVKAILHETGLAAEYLEIELTENIILRDEEKVIRQIHQLKDLGISIALDDFGTGYSSISYLKKIPVDRIKIDRSYIANIDNNREDAAIVRAIIELAIGLNMYVIAEGVETLKQLQTLMNYQCVEVQGYYFSMPLPAAEVEKFLKPSDRNPLILT